MIIVIFKTDIKIIAFWSSQSAEESHLFCQFSHESITNKLVNFITFYNFFALFGTSLLLKFISIFAAIIAA